MDKYWYKNAIIYSADVETFKDSNSDGVGDFQGMRYGLTYLASLGVDCLWLLPFFQSPNRDNGYDVQNYYEIDSRLGDLGDFSELLETAEEKGIRILMDLPVNHTSTEHAWFQQGRADKDSKYRDFYIWSEEKPKDDGQNMMTKGEGGAQEAGDQESHWEWDETAKAYYFHTFFKHQPDLNIANKDVQKEIFRIMHFWLRLGVSGFRIDAAPHMFKEKGEKRFQGDPHEVFRNMREFVETQKKDAILLAEVDLEPNKYKDFFGDEDQMHMLFNFYVNNYLFLGFAEEKASVVAKALKKIPPLQEKEQMAIFIRNHDELNLDKLSETEREKVFEKFAPDKDMRIFGRGIRRRLAPILGNDRRKIELANSLMLTLPGTPVVRYGQEIGMGEDLSMQGRSSVRTLMQWADAKNAGFSDAEPDRLVRNLISEGEFGYKKVNVNAQQRDSDSLLNWMSRAIKFRKEFEEFGWGDYTILDTGTDKVLAHYRESERGFALALHNFSDKAITVTLKLEDADEIVDVFGNKHYEAFDPINQRVKLTAYGYRWLHKRKLFL